MTRIMVSTVCQVASGSGLRQFQAAQFLLDRVYIANFQECNPNVNRVPSLMVSKVLAGN
jgi:hypothetical protein